MARGPYAFFYGLTSLREVSTWRFREQIARSKKAPALQARKEVKNITFIFSIVSTMLTSRSPSLT